MVGPFVSTFSIILVRVDLPVNLMSDCEDLVFVGWQRRNRGVRTLRSLPVIGYQTENSICRKESLFRTYFDYLKLNFLLEFVVVFYGIVCLGSDKCVFPNLGDG